MKWIRLIALCMCAAMLLSGCNLVRVDETRDLAQVVAKVGDVEIKKDQVMRVYNINKVYYGITDAMEKGPTKAEAEQIKSLKTSVLDTLIRNEIIRQRVAAGGYNAEFSAEEQKEAEDNADGIIEDFIADAVAQAQTDGKENPEEEAQKQLEDAFTQSGSSRQALIDEYLQDTIAVNKLKKATVEGVVPTEEEIRTKYDADLLAQQEEYAKDASVFTEDMIGGEIIYTRPENFSLYKHILISLSVDDKAAVSALRNKATDAQEAYEADLLEIEDLRVELETAVIKSEVQTKIDDLIKESGELLTQINDYTKQADDKRIELAKNIQEKADAALLRVQNGEDFLAVMDDVGEDDGMKNEPTKSAGYALGAEGNSVMVPEFTSAARALKNIGDGTGLVLSDYGYHIIIKTGIVTAGDVPFDEVKDRIAEVLTTEKQNTKWTEEIEVWVKEDESKVKRYTNRL